MNKQQIERVIRMESYLDESCAAIGELSEALEKYESILDKYYELEEYYGNGDWMDDYDADRAGEFPDDLKRGVLSEDAVYDLITEHIELVTRLQKAVQRCMEIEPDKK